MVAKGPRAEKAWQKQLLDVAVLQPASGRARGPLFFRLPVRRFAPASMVFSPSCLPARTGPLQQILPPPARAEVGQLGCRISTSSFAPPTRPCAPAISGLRLIDRARRHAPNSGVIAHLYGRLLTMQGDLPAGARRATAPIP